MGRDAALPPTQQRFLEKGKTLAQRLDFELTDDAKESLVGYLIHWESQTFGVVVRKGQQSPLEVPGIVDGEYVNVIHARHVRELKPGYIIIACRYYKES